MKPASEQVAYILRPRRRRESIPGIRIEHVADKLRALRAIEYPEPSHQLAENPRLAELLLFIEWLSHQPGGIEQGVRDRLLAHFPENIGTPELHASKPARDGQFDCIEALLTVWESIPERFRRWPAGLTERHRDSFNLWLIEEPSRQRAIEREAGEHFRKIMAAITPDYCWRLCADASADLLPRLLADLCNQPGRHFPDDRDDENLTELADNSFLLMAARIAGEAPTHPARARPYRARREVWCYRNLTASLFAMMDRHASTVIASIAQTQVAKMIFDELDFALSSGVPVFIAGDSRFGKTLAHRTWCEAYPGRRRLINTPPTGREWDFYTAHADALGIGYSASANQRKLSSDVQFVIRHTGLFLCYDEAHHLIPAKLSRTSKPWRMDWVRCHVIDCGIPAAFIATRQTYGKSLAQFIKSTHHQMEQWFDRMHRPLMLPSEISEADLLAVAAHNFPTFTKRQLANIAAEAMCDEGGSAFHTVKLVAKMASFLAQKAGRSTPSDDDVKHAIADWKARPCQRDFENPVAAPLAPAESTRAGTTAPTVKAGTKPDRAARVQSAGGRPAKPAPATPGREISPVNFTSNQAPDRKDAGPVLVV